MHAMHLEREAHAYLGGEGNANCCAWSKEIAERPGRDQQLFTARDRLGLRAGGVEAEGRDVGEVVYRRGQCADIGDVVGTRVVAVEEVEEFDEGCRGPTLVERERSRNPDVGLQIGCAAELVERGFDAVYYGSRA